MENPIPEDTTPKGEWRVSMVPSGSIDRGMLEEKRNDDPAAEWGTLNSGRLIIPPKAAIFLQSANVFQRKEGSAKSDQESDQSIVVRDGNAVHKAKGLAERHCGQSTHAPGPSSPGFSVSSSLSALQTKAKQCPKHRFRDLYRLINRQMLTDAYHRLNHHAIPGIDGITWKEYGQRLEEHLTQLEIRLREGRYRAPHVKRQWIAKPGSNKLRPLGIPVIEDKIVQRAVVMILEPIYESDFLDESLGYRPGKAARPATMELTCVLDPGTYRWVVEADIRGFFEHIDHAWLIKMLEERIDDRSLIRLICKWLKAGVLEDEGRVTHPEEGTPQGGVISPLLANIYLHYVQDLWIEKRVKPGSKGRVLFRRFADDSIVCFEREDDARRYLRELPKRLAKFNLSLADEKSALVKFNRWECDDSGKFTFLGFDFFWEKTRQNPLHRLIKRRTSAKKFGASLAAMKDWLKGARSLPLADIMATLRRKMQGYFNYYGVVGNSARITRWYHEVTKLVFKWLNRRSQRKSFTWATFSDAWESWKLPAPKITEKPPARSARQRASKPATC